MNFKDLREKKTKFLLCVLEMRKGFVSIKLRHKVVKGRKRNNQEQGRSF